MAKGSRPTREYTKATKTNISSTIDELNAARAGELRTAKRGLSYQEYTPLFHQARNAASEAQKLHEKANVEVRVAAAEYGENSPQYKAAIEQRKKALRHLKKANRASNDAGSRLNEIAHKKDK